MIKNAMTALARERTLGNLLRGDQHEKTADYRKALGSSLRPIA
jgi:hypothetical protein